MREKKYGTNIIHRIKLHIDDKSKSTDAKWVVENTENSTDDNFVIAGIGNFVGEGFDSQD